MDQTKNSLTQLLVSYLERDLAWCLLCANSDLMLQIEV